MDCNFPTQTLRSSPCRQCLRPPPPRYRPPTTDRARLGPAYVRVRGHFTDALVRMHRRQRAVEQRAQREAPNVPAGCCIAKLRYALAQASVRTSWRCRSTSVARRSCASKRTAKVVCDGLASVRGTVVLEGRDCRTYLCNRVLVGHMCCSWSHGIGGECETILLYIILFQQRRRNEREG